MKTLKALKSRREGIEKINKITRAMEVIAATRLRRYEEEALRLRPYIQVWQSVIKNLALRLKKLNSPWTKTARNKGGLVILISSDRGFCGGFNNQLLQLVKNLEDKQDFSFIVIGKKGTSILKRQQFNLIDDSTLPDDNQIEDVVQRITGQVISIYREQGKKAHLIFNRFRRNLLGQGLLRQIFPLEVPEQEGMVSDYLFEPDAQTVLDKVLPVYVSAQIQTAILESKAAEEMARMVAMTQARRSAEDLIKSLTLQYHKARQAGITRELVEIANAIR